MLIVNFFVKSASRLLNNPPGGEYAIHFKFSY